MNEAASVSAAGPGLSWPAGLACLCVGTAPLVGLLLAPAIVPLISLLALCCLVEAARVRRFIVPAVVLVGLPAVAWAAFSVFWSFAPSLSLRVAPQVLGSAVAVLALCGTVPALDQQTRGRLLIACICGVLAGALFLAVDLPFRGALTALIRGWNMGVEEEASQAFRNTSRGVAAIAVLAWPAAAGAVALKQRRLAAILLVASAVVVLAAHTTTVKLAFVGALLMFGAAFWRPRLAAAAIAIGFACWALAAPLWIDALPSPYASSIINREGSLLHRVIIWKFAVEKLEQRPVLGWGLEASRAVPGATVIVTAPYHAPAAIYPTDYMLLPLHPHNAFLQWWLELGIVGLLLFLAIPAFLLRRATKLAPVPRAFRMAGLFCGLFVSAASFGAWQAWWIFVLLLAGTAFAWSAGEDVKPR